MQAARMRGTQPVLVCCMRWAEKLASLLPFLFIALWLMWVLSHGSGPSHISLFFVVLLWDLSGCGSTERSLKSFAHCIWVLLSLYHWACD